MHFCATTIRKHPQASGKMHTSASRAHGDIVHRKKRSMLRGRSIVSVQRARLHSRRVTHTPLSQCPARSGAERRRRTARLLLVRAPREEIPHTRALSSPTVECVTTVDRVALGTIAAVTVFVAACCTPVQPGLRRHCAGTVLTATARLHSWRRKC